MKGSRVLACSTADVSSLAFLARDRDGTVALAGEPARDPQTQSRLPPVTITLRMAANQFSGLSNRQGRNEIDHGRDFVRGKLLTAELQDILLVSDARLLLSDPAVTSEPRRRRPARR